MSFTQAEIDSDALALFAALPGVRRALARPRGVAAGDADEVTVLVVVESGARPGERPRERASQGGGTERTVRLLVPRGDPALGQLGLPGPPANGWRFTLLSETATPAPTARVYTTVGTASDMDGHWEVEARA